MDAYGVGGSMSHAIPLRLKQPSQFIHSHIFIYEMHFFMTFILAVPNFFETPEGIYLNQLISGT